MTDDTARLDAIEARAKAVPAEMHTWEANDEHGAVPGCTPAWCVNDMRDGRWAGDVADIPQVAEWDEAVARHIAGLDPETALWLVGLARDSHTKDAEIEPGNLAQALIDTASRMRDLDAKSALLAASRMVDAVVLRREAAERERDDARAQAEAVKKAALTWATNAANHGVATGGLAAAVAAAIEGRS